MRARKSLVVVVVAVLTAGGFLFGSQEPEAKAKKKGAKKAEAVELDPSGRPEGSIVDQTARYYVWHDGQGWHVRTTAKGARNFNGTIRVKDAKIKTYKSVGLKDGKQGGAADMWRVNDERTELRFQFKTAKLSDGLDFVLDGEAGEVEFELNIDSTKNPRAIFVGRGLQHPGSNPFRLPAAPKKAK